MRTSLRIFFFFLTTFLSSELNSQNLIIIDQLKDLKGERYELPENVSIQFKNNGGFVNGTVVGNNNVIKKGGSNVFHNCIIEGNWRIPYASSEMFDDSMPANLLLSNMQILSKELRLSSKRTYDIERSGYKLRADKISSDDSGYPQIVFHTIDPNVCGLNIESTNLCIRHISFIDDFSSDNPERGQNKITIGSTIGITSPKGATASVKIEDCKFEGGTPSSYIASSTTADCRVLNCTFSGIMADHAVYCSTNIERFEVANCYVSDVPRTAGLFKVRTSPKLQEVILRGIRVSNLNGYFGILGLLRNDNTVITVNNVTIDRKGCDNYVNYGICIYDDQTVQKVVTDYTYNAGKIVIKNSNFGYGYDGNAILYAGSEKKARIKDVIYQKVNAHNSFIDGCNVDNIIVGHSTFEFETIQSPFVMFCKTLTLKNSKIINKSTTNVSNLFTFNYASATFNELKVARCNFDVKCTNLVSVKNTYCPTRINIKQSNLHLLSSTLQNPLDPNLLVKQKNNIIKR